MCAALGTVWRLSSPALSTLRGSPTISHVWLAHPFFHKVCVRHVSQSATGAPQQHLLATTAQVLKRGITCSLVGFEVSPQEAITRFERYQQQSCGYLHASSVLKLQPAAPGGTLGHAEASGRASAASGSTSSSSGSTGPAAVGAAHQQLAGVEGSLTAAYLPFWCFDIVYSTQAEAKIGFKDAATGEMVWRELQEAQPISTQAARTCADPALQVYASYLHTRDLAEGASGPGLPQRARALSWQEAQQQEAGGVVLHAPTMRQGVAWQLACRRLMHEEVAAAGEAVKACTRAADVKDVHVSLQVHSRLARLVFLPAYIARYQYGTRYKQGTAGVIVPQIHYALVGGTRDGGVCAPQHVSPAKASLGVAGLVGGLGLLAGAGGLPLGPVEALTLATLAASGAGMWAHQRPQAQKMRLMAEQVRADYEFYKQYDLHEPHGSGAADGGASGAAGPGRRHEDYMLWLWQDADWRRWENDEPWNWEEAERAKWADELWRKQALRRLERQRYVARMAAEAERRAAEERAETQRERMHGSSSRARYSHRPSDHGMGAQQQQQGAYDEEEEDAAGGGSGSPHSTRRRRRDFLGYYKVLGLEAAEAVSSDDIKTAFKLQALQFHPDRHVASDEDTQRVAHVKFQKLQIAYDVLKDSDKRSAYDRGQLVH